MKTRFTILLGLLLAACQPKAPRESVQSLLDHPNHLKDVVAACRDHRPAVDPELCAAAAEAERRRFMGNGRSQYTPRPVEVAPNEPGRQ